MNMFVFCIAPQQQQNVLEGSTIVILNLEGAHACYQVRDSDPHDCCFRSAGRTDSQ